MNQVESPTQPKPFSKAPLIDFPQVTAHASGNMLIAATTALGVSRVIRACLPVRCDSSNRVLPTPSDAIPFSGLPPHPPPGQNRPQPPSHRTILPTPHRAVRPSDSSESSPTPLFIASSMCVRHPRHPNRKTSKTKEEGRLGCCLDFAISPRAESALPR